MSSKAIPETSNKIENGTDRTSHPTAATYNTFTLSAIGLNCCQNINTFEAIFVAAYRQNWSNTPFGTKRAKI